MSPQKAINIMNHNHSKKYFSYYALPDYIYQSRLNNIYKMKRNRLIQYIAAVISNYKFVVLINMGTAREQPRFL